MPTAYTRSARNNPCPACGRTKDADCSWTSEVILCHQGSKQTGISNLRLGDTITIKGREWALVGLNKGYSGRAAVLKPHSGKGGAHGISPSQLSAIEDMKAKEALEHRMRDMKIIAFEILEMPPYEQLLDYQIKAYRDKAEYAFEAAKAIEAQLARLAKHEHYCAMLLEEHKPVRRDLYYQLKDLNRYCDNPGKYWEQFILNKPPVKI